VTIPPHTPSSPNATDKYFDIAILLKIVQRSYNKNFRFNDRCCKLCPGGIYGFYGREAPIDFKEGSFDWKLKILFYFLKFKRDRRATSPPRPLPLKPVR